MPQNLGADPPKSPLKRGTLTEFNLAPSFLRRVREDRLGLPVHRKIWEQIPLNPRADAPLR